MRAIGQAQRTPPPRRVPRIAFATLGVFIALNVVTAGLANAAVPGDPLYPLDRGYESVLDVVGVGGDHSEERITEAEALVARDDLTGAADLVAEAIDGRSIREAVASLQDADPTGPGFSDTVQALVTSARDLVAARQDGEPTRMAEARAAVDLAAMQVSQVAGATPVGPPDQAGNEQPPDHAGSEGPPDHTRSEGPPDHARDEETPADTRPDPSGPPDDPGRSDGSGSQGPDEPPGPPEDPPGQSGQRESQGPPDEPSGGPSGQGSSPRPSEDPPGQSRQDGSQESPGQSGQRGGDA